MSKGEENARPPLRERAKVFVRSLTPTVPERVLVAAVLISMLAGALVMHYRREYRIAHPAVEGSATPRRGGF